jgi:hypothetical protein
LHAEAGMHDASNAIDKKSTETIKNDAYLNIRLRIVRRAAGKNRHYQQRSSEGANRTGAARWEFAWFQLSPVQKIGTGETGFSDRIGVNHVSASCPVLCRLRTYSTTPASFVGQYTNTAFP